MADTVSNNDEVRKPRKGKTRRRRKDPLVPILKRMLVVQIIIIVVLMINTALLVWLWGTSSSQSAILTVDSEDQIVLETYAIVNDNITYNVLVDLKNIGEEVAYVSLTGEVLVSLYGSAYGEEVLKVLDYASGSVSPGETKQFDLGSFTTTPGWHYVVKAHVTWNGGTLELTRILT
jgi:hypothetical protein